MTQGTADALRLNDITKRFGKLTANDAVSFSVGEGEVVALLGENGAGKTTLMNILFGHYVQMYKLKWEDFLFCNFQMMFYLRMFYQQTILSLLKICNLD